MELIGICFNHTLFIEWIYSFIIMIFRYIYVKGPAIKGIGFWENQNEEDICAEITKVSASHWKITDINYQECQKLINRKVESFMIGSFLLFSLFLLYYIMNYLFFIRPFIVCSKYKSNNLNFNNC